MNALRAATYSRYSSDQQRESSIEDQQRGTYARAAKEGWEIVADYADAAMSGADNQRPQYRRMLTEAGRTFDVLLIDALSRLARDRIEQEQAIRRLEFHGVRIVSTTDGYDSQSKARKVHRAVKGLMDEMQLDDLAAAVHRGQAGQAQKGRWNGGRPYGYRLRRLVDPARRDAYGEPERIGTVLTVDAEQAPIVREIFERYARGESTLQIASDLNARGVPSPGSSWKRTVRRCKGWMDSSVRVILLNPLYTGRQRWNTSQFVRDPETKRYLRRERPESEWVVRQIEELRIVSDELFARAQRFSTLPLDDPRRRSGGKARFVLSGLMSCAKCGRSMVLWGKHHYTCGSYVGGRSCDNHARVRRTHAEDVILGPILDDMMAPARITRIAREVVRDEQARLQAAAAKAPAPKALAELDSRLLRLRARMASGDPDMAADEIQAAIDTATAKRQALAAGPQRRDTAGVAKLEAFLPRAAELFRKTVKRGLDGDPAAAAEARTILRSRLLLGGKITVGPDEKGIVADFTVTPGGLLSPLGTGHRGDRI